MNPAALFVLLFAWPLVWGWVMDAVLHAASTVEHAGE